MHHLICTRKKQNWIKVFVFKLSVSQTVSPEKAVQRHRVSYVLLSPSVQPALIEWRTNVAAVDLALKHRWPSVRCFFRPHAVILLPWSTRVGASADLIWRNNCFCLKGQAIPGSVRYPRTGTDPWGPR